MFERFRNRKHRHAYREMLARWNADGGDARFRFDYELKPDSLVLDVGGYEGQWAQDLYARQRCQIHIFEPVHNYADAIRNRFADNPDVEVHPFALGARTRQETLSIAGASSSAHRRKRSLVEVDFRDVNDWFEKHAVNEIALMKINIEGGEYELLDRILDCGITQMVAAFQIQFHYFVDNAEARMAAIQERLADTHSPTWQYRFIWENWQRKSARG